MDADECRVLPDSYTLISTALLGSLLGLSEQPCRTPPLPPRLRNRYFALRHGQSEANLEGIISSDPSVGTVIHGLTPMGKLQARRAATTLIDAVGREQLDRLYFYSSDFTRAAQTADEALAGVINVLQYENAAMDEDSSAALPEALTAGVRRTPLLRERYFGELEAQELINYQKVWPRDLVSAAHTSFSVESVEAVAARVRSFILQAEEAHSHATIVLVSHADTLQISQCFIAGADCRTFCQYRFQNGEVRELAQGEDTLPAPVPLSYQ